MNETYRVDYTVHTSLLVKNGVHDNIIYANLIQVHIPVPATTVRIMTRPVVRTQELVSTMHTRSQHMYPRWTRKS